ncbi:NAD-dependent epimerase/dehydratase family protein [Uliginosibacterium sediminicola]|uniref:NAD-dependent epimerase/dehydratase family protein n=1 Tax=Uliginosibacterium sediminicola TaxID=2024550 RepID=A0ABU9YX69_9RHOO
MDTRQVILVTGCNGQIGRVLVPALRARHGNSQVIATDLRGAVDRQLDVTDTAALLALLRELRPTQIYHLAAVLSATGERDPVRAWQVNLNGYFNVLEGAVAEGVERVFFPSSIAVYGPDVPREATPDDAPTRPSTIYGIAKAAGENLAAWYREKHGLDVRVLRYPGIIGWESAPGGGTTDYAVEIFHAAVKGETFVCPLSAERALPMLAMADAVRGTLDYMAAPREQIRRASGYNLGGFSAAPADFAAAIRSQCPSFQIDYQPDARDRIAASWPAGLDDRAAREDWGWQPHYTLERLSLAMLAHLGADYSAQQAAKAATHPRAIQRAA